MADDRDAANAQQYVIGVDLGSQPSCSVAATIVDGKIVETSRIVLPLLSDRARCAEQKWQMKTRVDKSDAKDREDKRLLELWRAAVYAADRFLCRCCGVKVKRTLKLTGVRAEAHHVAGRADLAVRYDVRNGLTLCYRCHRRVTGNVADKLVIVGSVFFTIETTRYIDAREPVEFQEAA